MVIDVGRPGQDVAVEFRQARRRCLVPLEPGHTMRGEGLARQAFQGRQLALVAVEPVRLVAFVEQKAEPGRRCLEHRGVNLRVPVEETGHQDHRDPQRSLGLEILHVRQE